MPRRKLSTTVYMTQEQCDRLKRMSERTKVPMSEVIREGIDMALASWEARFPEAEAVTPAGSHE